MKKLEESSQQCAQHPAKEITPIQIPIKVNIKGNDLDIVSWVVITSHWKFHHNKYYHKVKSEIDNRFARKKTHPHLMIYA